jgi:hypothetical protein
VVSHSGKQESQRARRDLRRSAESTCRICSLQNTHSVVDITTHGHLSAIKGLSPYVKSIRDIGQIKRRMLFEMLDQVVRYAIQ